VNICSALVFFTFPTGSDMCAELEIEIGNVLEMFFFAKKYYYISRKYSTF
jgi:hypothetical protein